MKKIFAILPICLTLVACDRGDDAQNIVRQCGDYAVEMSFSDDGTQMHAIINGDELTLNQAVSASGARYVGVLNDTDVILWGRGDQWTLFLNEDTPIECNAK